MSIKAEGSKAVVEKALEREERLSRRARQIAESVVRHRLREETLSDEEREELINAVYEDQIKRLRAKKQ